MADAARNATSIAWNSRALTVVQSPARAFNRTSSESGRKRLQVVVDCLQLGLERRASGSETGAVRDDERRGRPERRERAGGEAHEPPETATGGASTACGGWSGGAGESAACACSEPSGGSDGAGGIRVASAAPSDRPGRRPDRMRRRHVLSSCGALRGEPGEDAGQGCGRNGESASHHLESPQPGVAGVQVEVSVRLDRHDRS